MIDHQLVECYALPDQGRFLVGRQYMREYIIDGIKIIDEDGIEIFFDEIKWLWYFR